MEKNKFSKFFVASIKRTAQNVYPLVRRRNNLTARIEDMQKEIATLNKQIDAYQIPIKEATGGYTTEDLVERVIVETDKVDQNGKTIKLTQFNLKYPETIVPVTEETTETQEETPQNPPVEPTNTESTEENSSENFEEDVNSFNI